MFKRDWVHFIALGGCLVLALGPCKAQSDSAAQAAQSEQKQETPKPLPPPIAQQAEQKADSGNYKRSCDPAKGREEDDLCQQVRMAQAAEDAVDWDKWQTRIGIGGLIGVALSLISLDDPLSPPPAPLKRPRWL